MSNVNRGSIILWICMISFSIIIYGGFWLFNSTTGEKWREESRQAVKAQKRKCIADGGRVIESHGGNAVFTIDWYCDGAKP